MARVQRKGPSGPPGQEKYTIAANFGTIGPNITTEVAVAVTSLTTFDNVSITVKDSPAANAVFSLGQITTNGSITVRAGNVNTVNAAVNTVTFDVTVMKYRT